LNNHQQPIQPFFIRRPALPSAGSSILPADGNPGLRMKTKTESIPNPVWQHATLVTDQLQVVALASGTLTQRFSIVR